MRIVCIIPGMQSGGAERVMSLLVGHWVRTGYAVELLTYESKGTHSFYPLDLRVTYKPLDQVRISRNLLEALLFSIRRAIVLRRAIAKARPNVIVSFCAQMNVMTLAASRGLSVPVIVSERAPPAAHVIGRFWQLGRRWLYPLAKAVVVQTAAAKDYFPNSIQKRCVIIPNPVPLVNYAHVKRQLRILAVGRLSSEKGFDLLLRAFSLVQREHPGWSLRIVGEGVERQALQALACHLGVDHVLEMPGLAKDMAAEYASASLFALSSRYEGFPNALCEAMASGLPVAAFACAGGVDEIVQDGVNGVLAAPGDPVSLATKLGELLSDSGRREKLGRAAVEVARRYTPDMVFAQWDSCIASVRFD